MVTADDGWGFSVGALFRTTDGGRNWTQVLRPPRNMSAEGSAIAAGFYGSSDVWVAVPGQGTMTLYDSHDAAGSWRKVTLSVPDGHAEPIPRFIDFVDATHGWLWAGFDSGGAESGTLFATVDGGKHWTPVAQADSSGTSAIPLEGSKTGLAFRNDENGWLTVGDPALGVAQLYATSDGGRTWVLQDVPPPRAPGALQVRSLLPVTFANGSGVLLALLSQSGAGAASEEIYRTPDWGGTWHQAQEVSADTVGLFVSFPDSQHGVLTDGRDMYVTTDGGATWTSFTPNVSLLGIAQLDFLSPQVGFALLPQPDGLVLATTDGGHSWSGSHPPAHVVF